MKRQDRMLFLSGLAATVSLILSAAGLTIAIIAAVQPPVSEYFSAARNAAQASRVFWLWPMVLLNVCISVWLLAQVVLRRPIPAKFAGVTRVTNTRIGIVSALTLVTWMLAFWSLYYTFRAMEGTSPITDSTAFSGLAINSGSMSGTIAILGFVLFARWTDDTQDPAIHVQVTPSPRNA